MDRIVMYLGPLGDDTTYRFRKYTANDIAKSIAASALELPSRALKFNAMNHAFT